MEFKVEKKINRIKIFHSTNFICRAIIPPIVTSATYAQTSPGEHSGYQYSRYGNPTRNALEKCLASLDNARHALAFSAGIGTLTAIMTMLEAGDGVISSKNFYAGAFKVFDAFAKHGIEVQYVDFSDVNNVIAALKENTKMVWIESPTNPLMGILDIRAIAEAVHANSKAFLAVDNTFLTPYFQRPLELGADVVAYSISKFIGGHSDIIGGSIATNDEELYEKLKSYQIAIGLACSPFDSYLINRSLKTLAIRMEKHFENSYQLAKFLESHQKIEKVHYPALESHEEHKIAINQSYGHSGIFSFTLKDATPEKSQKLFKSFKLITVGESLGGTETLASYPWLMTHKYLPENERIKSGVTCGLIRISVGLEDIRDIIEDMENALREIS